MSTKTTFKRVALVAVASLGFGVLSVVAPTSASAAEPLVTELTAIQLNGVSANVSVTQREDVATANYAIGVVIDSTDIASANDIATLYAAFSSKPAASALTNASLTFGTSANAVANDSAGTMGATIATAGSGSAAAKLQLDPTASDSLITDTDVGNLAFTPDVPGTYIVRVWHDANSNLIADSTEATRTLTVVAGAAASTLTVTQYAATATALSDNVVDTLDHGSLFILSLKDAGGNATALAAGEGISITATGCTISLDGGSNSVSDTATLTSSTSPSLGKYRVNVYKSAAGSCVATFAGAGSLAGVVASTSNSITFKTATDSDAATYAIDMTTGVDVTTVGAGTTTGGTAVAASSASGAVTFSVTSDDAGTSRYVNMSVIDTYGAITGYVNAKYSQAVALTDTDGTATNYASVTVTPATWSTSTRPDGSSGASVYGVNFADATASSAATDGEGVTVTATTTAMSATLSTWNVTTINATTGSVVTVTLNALDQFGNAWANKAITFSKAGRNALTTATTAAVTDADGNATFTYTDAGTATSSTVDTISATTITATVTVTYDAANAPSTVTVTSGDTTAGVADLSVDYKDILAGKAGPTTSAYDVTATVKNASAIAVAGVPVTWTVAGEGCAIPSNEQTTYTSATGVATSAVYAWLAGKCTVTATAAGKTGTGVTSFRQESTSEIRTLSGSVSGQLVTAAPKDRFGNPVINATVYAVISAGAGYFGTNGARSATLTTDSTGTASVVVAGGSASVKLTTINPAGTGLASDQSTAAAGNVAGDVATPVAFTATTVGTAATAETGVGATFSAAGVSSVTVEVAADTTTSDAATAASDAAAEATDAANAATDAANAAAEAADAATAAAQDAADAVAALSAQVATLISGLKSQLTALTNLVIKIQKKVKA
jgi:hypothetical protein